MKKYDAIIIGGGHNGLTTAAYLGRAGKKVLVLERRHVLGGAAVTEEVYPGFKYTVFSYVVSLLRPEIIRDFNLPMHGLETLPLESTVTPLPDGRYLARWGDHDKTRRELLKFSRRDAEAYDEFGRSMYQMAKGVKPILNMVPPTSLGPLEAMELFNLFRHFTGLGEEKFYTFFKLMTMSSADFLDEWFETEPLKATMSASGIIGTFMGPRSPGTAYVLLHHYMGEIDGVFRAWGFAKGGTGSVSEAIAGAARQHGAEIRVNASVKEIILKNGQAVGVALEDGEEIYAKIVATGLDPKRTFLKMVDQKALPSDFVQDIKNFNIRGSSGKVNLALDGLPNFKCLPTKTREGQEMLRGAISFSPSIDYIEQAYDDAKRGQFARKPYIDCIIPSMIDPDMAPPGKHVMSCFVQYAPYDIEGGWDDKKREAFGDAVVNVIAEYAPNLKNLILHRQVLTPVDIENMTGLTEGNIFQGELTLNQLFFLRPAPKWANFRSPIRNLYQCGSAAHPGGGISGAPGRLAAFEILKDM
jgi:phytoene dehydrogenase-like protein